MNPPHTCPARRPLLSWPARRWLRTAAVVLSAGASLHAAGATPAAAAGEVPTGTPEAHTQGLFGPTFAWPLIPIHSVLLPDGQVLAYGSGLDGSQGAALYYAVWNPALGTTPASMTVLDNRTGTDVFCSSASLMPNGQVLLLGGDRTVGTVRNYANEEANVFDPASLSLTRQAQPMAFQRWYATTVSTAQGAQLVLGGRADRTYAGDPFAPATRASYATTPELLRPGQPWQTLTGATSNQALGSWQSNWYYPKAWQTTRGRVLIVGNAGVMYTLSPQGAGSLSPQPFDGTLPDGHALLPSVMFAEQRVLSLRMDKQAVVIRLAGKRPDVQATAALDQVRYYAHATVLADGRVWVNGGSSSGNSLAGAAYGGQLWSPESGTWAPTARAAWPRLYHSTSLLLADGTVLTAGGGAPGPLSLLNGEIYYPPYLFDAQGQPAKRPAIASAPTQATWGDTLALQLAKPANIRRATLIRTGAATHNFNPAQRFIPLGVRQNGLTLSLSLPHSRELVPPGHYLLFVVNGAGVPSVARVLRVS